MNKGTARGKLALQGGHPVRVDSFPAWPVFGREDEDNLLEVLRSGKWWYGDRVREFEKRFAAFQDARHGVTCCNGTVALELALRTVGVQAGDEVLVPAYTFIATASAVLTVHAVPVFIDVELATLNMDLTLAERAITRKTRAIIVVHFAGLPMDMDQVRALAARHDLILIEDAAHAWGSQWQNQGIGSWGAMGTFSFQMTKNITAGEGGIILTNNDQQAQLARSYSHCGRIEGRPWYEHEHIGGNYRLTELQAAILLAQLNRLEAQTTKREENARRLDAFLARIPGLNPPVRDSRVTRRAYHLYVFRFDARQFGEIHRDQFISALNAEGIPASPGYLTPVYGNRCFQNLECVPGLPSCPVSYQSVYCPVAERLCREEIVWLPHQLLLGNTQDIADVASAIEKIHAHQGELTGRSASGPSGGGGH